MKWFKKKSLILDQKELNKLYQYAQCLCRNKDDAFDIVHSALEKVLRLAKTTKIDNPMALMRLSIRHVFIDQGRYYAKRHEEVLDENNYQADQVNNIHELSLENIVITQELAAQLWESLAPQDRDIFYHWAILGYSTDQACEIIGVPRGTFLARVHRVRQRFAKRSSSKIGAVK